MSEQSKPTCMDCQYSRTDTITDSEQYQQVRCTKTLVVNPQYDGIGYYPIVAVLHAATGKCQKSCGTCGDFKPTQTSTEHITILLRDGRVQTVYGPDHAAVTVINLNNNNIGQEEYKALINSNHILPVTYHG